MFTGTHTDTVCCQNNEYRRRTLGLSYSPLPPSLYLQPHNEPCCTVLFTPASYQWFGSTEAANWRGQATVLPVPCSGVGVERHAPSTFLSRLRKDWARARLPLKIIKHAHTHQNTQDEFAIRHHSYTISQVLQHT